MDASPRATMAYFVCESRRTGLAVMRRAAPMRAASDPLMDSAVNSSSLATPGPTRSWIRRMAPPVTEEVCLLSRWVAADRLERDVQDLRDDLSLSEASAELRARVGDARLSVRACLQDDDGSCPLDKLRQMPGSKDEKNGGACDGGK